MHELLDLKYSNMCVCVYMCVCVCVHTQLGLLVLKYGLLLVLNEIVLIAETMPKIGKM